MLFCTFWGKKIRKVNYFSKKGIIQNEMTPEMVYNFVV